MPFPDAHFDKVLNHESFCYAQDKLAYLRGVYRVLKRGGRWQALEGLLSGASMSEAQEEAHAIAQRGWRMPPLEPWRDVLATLEQAGFDEIHEKDFSSEAAQSTDRISKRWLMLTFLTSPSAWVNRVSQEFMEATIGYDQGLREGVFSYRFLSGARPK